MSTDLMTVAGIAGLAATLATAILTRVTTLPPRARPWVAIAMAALAGIAGLWLTWSPTTWQAVATTLAAVLGVTQIVYTAFKPVVKVLNGDLAVTAPNYDAGPVPTAIIEADSEAGTQTAIIDLPDNAATEPSHE